MFIFCVVDMATTNLVVAMQMAQDWRPQNSKETVIAAVVGQPRSKISELTCKEHCASAMSASYRVGGSTTVPTILTLALYRS